jgi:ribosomal protein L11 methylase PrmA
VPTPVDIVDKMAEIAKIGKDDVIFDPGCGDAIMLIRPVKLLGAKKGIGIDIDPNMVKKAQEKAKTEGVAEKVVIKAGDILNEKDMAICAEASVVLVYIGDDLGARMAPVLQKLLKPGTRIVSHRFGLGDWKPEKTITVRGADGEDYVLHYWVVKEKDKK